MADPIAIILEFLQRYNLSNTEATLRSELRARQGGTCFSLPSYALRETETVSEVYKEQPKADSEPDLSNTQFAFEQRSLVDHLSKPRLENFSFISEPTVRNIPLFEEQIIPNVDKGGNRALIMPRIENNSLLKHRDEDLKISLMAKKITSHNIYTEVNMHKNQSLDGQLQDETCIASTRVQSSGQRSKTEETSCGNHALAMPRAEKNPSLKHKEEDLALMEKKITSHNSYTQENTNKTQSLDVQLQDETCIASAQVQSSGQRRKTEETSWEQLKGLPLFESINETHHSNPEAPQFDKPMIITENKNSLLNSEKIILSQVSPDSEYGLKKKQAYKTMEDDAALMYPKKESENETMLSWDMDFYNDNTGFIGYEELKEYKAKSNSDFSRLSHLRLTSLNMGEDPNNDGFRLDSMADTGPSTNTASTLTSSFELGCYLDAPMGQDIAGNKWLPVNSQLSSRHSIVEESPELLSGFATLGDGPDDSGVGFSLEYWGSDTYDDEEDPGYIRQPIEDEAWFLANEIDYLSDEDGEKSSKETSGHLQKDTMKPEDLYCFSGDQLCNRSLNDSQAVSSMDKGSKSVMDIEEIKLLKTEPIRPGSVAQSSVQKGVSYEMDNQRKGLERLSGTENGSEVRDSLIGGSSEGDVENLRDREPSGYDAVYSVWENSDNEGNESINSVVLSGGYFDEDGAHKSLKSDQNIKTKRGFLQYPNRLDEDSGEVAYGGFSFPSPLTTSNLVEQKAEKEKFLWSTCDNLKGFGDRDIYSNGVSGPDDTVITWKRKSNDLSPMINLRQELSSSVHSTLSPQSSGSDVVLGRRKQGETKEREEVAVITAHDVDNEETIALQEQIRRIRAEEDDYEIFNLRIIHRKDRTGFEEEKNFPVVMNSIIAGRYHVTEYLGSAAFSKAIQAHDLQTGMDVCMKIIKNNKDFFDQSLDEIKLLKYVNKHDPADKYHILRLYDYFYYHEHLFIVCELLRANLYEFQKFNREAGGEVYFTMPRLQSIARQCLESIEFLHCLGLVHCDLKPENILIKSYSRCEIKVIDLGSSCFQTDHLCPYVQSRSYRAPEVILGLPYNHKIDIWSLGCILAELCSGHVLFQNDSLATLLARVIGIIGPIVPEMLAKGHDTHKYFTKSDMLYERSPETNQVEYLVPKKTSLRHRLPLADQGFVDFVAYLLQINPENRPTSTEALKHPWLSYPYDPISS